MAKTVDVWKQMVPAYIHKSDTDAEKAQFVCVNGRTFQVPKGKTVMVPLPVYEALREARRATAAAAAYERSVRAQT